jgi:hypothetical protein
MEPEVFEEPARKDWSSWSKWEARCKELGLEGPYKLTNMPGCWQFVRPAGGTGAIYNAAQGKGYVFRDAPTVSAGKS